MILGHSNREVSSLRLAKVDCPANLQLLHVSSDVVTFGIDNHHKIWSWGSNNRYAVGTSTPTFLPSPIKIEGNISVTTSITLNIPQGADTSGKPLLSVEGCVNQMQQLTMLLSLTEDEIKGSKIDPKLLIETAADCVGQENTLLTVKTSQPNLVRRSLHP